MNLAVYINGRLAKSKKAVKEAWKDNPDSVEVACTDMFHSFGGSPRDLPEGDHYFVGPDPERDRRFYGSIKKHGDQVKIS